MNGRSRRRLIWLVSGVLLVAWVMVAVANFGAQDLWHYLPDRSRDLVRLYRPLILTAGLVLFGAVLAWYVYALGNAELRRQDEMERQYERALVDVALKHQLQRILDVSPDMIALIDRKGVVRAINPASNLIMGYAPPEILGRRSLSLIHPADVKRARRTFASAGRLGIRKLEVRCLRQDGSHVWIEWNGVLLPDRRELYCVGRDISERKAHEEQRIRLEQIQREFVSTVSHELRTPLASIHGALGILRLEAAGHLDAQSARLLEIATRNTERLVRLVGDILNLERIESGRMDVHLQVCSATALIEQSLASVQTLMDSSCIHVEFEVEEVHVLADPDRVIQVFTNLLSNAVKFSAPETVVTIRAKGTELEAVFSVQDHGRGIPHDRLEWIFEPFAQVEASDSRQRGGAGLGLTIVKSLVAKMGGRVWVESQVGVGSRFCFTLNKASWQGPAVWPGHVAGQSAGGGNIDTQHILS